MGDGAHRIPALAFLDHNEAGSKLFVALNTRFRPIAEAATKTPSKQGLREGQAWD